jgi:hypothetical protein
MIDTAHAHEPVMTKLVAGDVYVSPFIVASEADPTLLHFAVEQNLIPALRQHKLAPTTEGLRP